MVMVPPTESLVCGVGPVSVGSVVWRFRGQLNVTVIAKAAFTFAQDADMQRGAPAPLHREDISHGNLPGRSARFTSDRAPYLGSADVMFTGYACSTQGPVRSMQVRLGVYRGATPLLDKMLLVHSAEPFERMPVVYERAFGGGPENPFGVGSGGLPEVPNILHPHDPERVGGFGPIACRWPLRKRLLGATPRRALEAPIVEIPDDFQWAYFQAAPADQQIAFLQGDEWILLGGLHPTHARLRMRLPNARGLARVHGLSSFGVPEGHGLVLVADTLHIDGAELACHVVWRRSFPLPDEAALEAVRVQAGVETLGRPVDWPAPSFSAALQPAPSAEADAELAITTQDILPEDGPPQDLPPASSTATLEISPGEAAAQRAALPFQAGPSRLDLPSDYPVARPARRPALSATVTVVPDDDPPGSVLPFRRQARAASPHAPGEEHTVQAAAPERRDAAAAPPSPPVASPPPAPTSWGWREEPAERLDVAAPVKDARPRKTDIQSILYGGKKRRR